MGCGASTAAQAGSNGNAGKARDRVNYDSEETLWEALKTRDVVLIRASWLKKLASEGGILPRRQDCPAEAFIFVDELQKMHNASTATPDHALNKRAPIIAVSHFWREKGHPDKNGVTLRIIGRALESQMQEYAFYGLTEMGVFFDWCSLYQEPREVDELASFKRSLEFINLWYAHALTTVYLVTDQPDGIIPYHERGWTTFECMLSYLTNIVDSYNVWPQVIDLGPEQSTWFRAASFCVNAGRRRPACISTGTRPAPAEPDAFCEGHLLGDKKFTNGADRELVARKFREASEDIFTSVAELDYQGLGWKDVDFQGIAVLLQCCKNLKRLNLSQTGITNIPDTVCHVQALVELKLNACTNLKELPESIGQLQALVKLHLQSCTKLTELPESIGRLQALEGLVLNNTPITALPESIGKLQALTGLSLVETHITSLPESTGDLKALTELDLRNCKALTKLPERIGQIQALALLILSGTAITTLPESIGKCQGLKTLLLDVNGLSSEQKQAVRTQLPECHVIYPRAEARMQS